MAWLVKDWLVQTHFAAPFLKLDYEKTFDRVTHGFFWAALAKIGLGGNLSCLFMDWFLGLSQNSTWMACSLMRFWLGGECHMAALVPTLVWISHTTLVGLLRFLLETDSLHGLPISSDLTVCYRLFANDMGMFIHAIKSAYWEARNAIALYKLAFRAYLNLAKSIVIPFRVPNTSLWLLNLGCKISSPCVIHKYLGVPWGFELGKAKLFYFFLANISKWLNLWSNCILSFMGRTLLIRYVL